MIESKILNSHETIDEVARLIRDQLRQEVVPTAIRCPTKVIDGEVVEVWLEPGARPSEATVILRFKQPMTVISQLK